MIRVAAIVCSVTAGVASVLMGKVGDEPGEIPHVYTPIRRWWRKKKATMFEDLQLSDEELSLRKDNDQIYNGDSSSSGNEYSNDSNTAGDGSSGSSSESDVCNVKVGLASLSNEADTVIRVDSSDDEGKRRNNTIFTR